MRVRRVRFTLNRDQVGAGNKRRFGPFSTKTKPSAGSAMSVMPLTTTELFGRREMTSWAMNCLKHCSDQVFSIVPQ
jgi:hypothetical protein